MQTFDLPEFPVSLIRSGHRPGILAEFRRGRALRLAPGIYVEVERWQRLAPWERYTWVVAAVSLRQPRAVFTAATALHVAGIPALAIPRAVHLAVESSRHVGLQPDVARVPAGVNAGHIPPRRVHQRTLARGSELIKVGEFMTVPLAEAAAGCLATMSYPEALTLADACARSAAPMGLDREAFKRQIALLPAQCRRDRASSILETSSGLVESVGESWSRAIMLTEGFEEPVLQQEFVVRGKLYRVDFWWPRWGIIGEFDGKGKLLDAGDGTRQATWNAVQAERERHFSLADVPEVKRLVRWGWEDLRTSGALRRMLVKAGVPRSEQAAGWAA